MIIPTDATDFEVRQVEKPAMVRLANQTKSQETKVNGSAIETAAGRFDLGFLYHVGSRASALSRIPEEEPEMPKAERFEVLSRSVARQTPEKEYDNLVRRHQELAGKTIFKGLTESEDRELQLVRWNLDRIEEARYAESDQAWETIVQTQENIAAKVSQVLDRFDRIIASQGRSAPHRYR